jgi:hypothetical protein
VRKNQQLHNTRSQPKRPFIAGSMTTPEVARQWRTGARENYLCAVRLLRLENGGHLWLRWPFVIGDLKIAGGKFLCRKLASLSG